MDLLCFSHLRWDFVYQRPQHLLSRFGNYYRVFYVEEPIFHQEKDSYKISPSKDNVRVVTPCLTAGMERTTEPERIENLLNTLIKSQQIESYILWYYTPMSLLYTRQLKPAITVYDCMDELSAFKFAPPLISSLEEELLDKADIVFTGGRALHASKKHLHANIFCFPSSIDKEHFVKARFKIGDPQDQSMITIPRFGFCGVIDERFDIELIASVASAKPDWNFVLVGPVVKIDPDTLPKLPNIHYLGAKSYDVLPSYIAGWDVALIPFAINESTRFISPTKTPEYLAAGKPVISTPIHDVVRPYGQEGLVHIVRNKDEFIAAGETILSGSGNGVWLKKVDAFLANNSWNNTWHEMNVLIEASLTEKKLLTLNKEIYV